jgi:hypothetical protein
MALPIITHPPRDHRQRSTLLCLAHDRCLLRPGRVGRSGPAADKITGLLMSPPGPAQILAETEHLIFSD